MPTAPQGAAEGRGARAATEIYGTVLARATQFTAALAADAQSSAGAVIEANRFITAQRAAVARVAVALAVLASAMVVAAERTAVLNVAAAAGPAWVAQTADAELAGAVAAAVTVATLQLLTVLTGIAWQAVASPVSTFSTLRPATIKTALLQRHQQGAVVFCPAWSAKALARNTNTMLTASVFADRRITAIKTSKTRVAKAATIFANSMFIALIRTRIYFVAFWARKARITEALGSQTSSMATATTVVLAHVNRAISTAESRLTHAIPSIANTISRASFRTFRHAFLRSMK